MLGWIRHQFRRCFTLMLDWIRHCSFAAVSHSCWTEYDTVVSPLFHTHAGLNTTPVSPLFHTHAGLNTTWVSPLFHTHAGLNTTLVSPLFHTHAGLNTNQEFSFLTCPVVFYIQVVSGDMLDPSWLRCTWNHPASRLAWRCQPTPSSSSSSCLELCE